VLNIGGIANVTMLPPACRQERVIAFDTGPGNMVVDALMKRLYRRDYDVDGRTALAGEIIIPLLASTMKHPYFRHPLPKSTGREEFGDRFVSAFMRQAGKVRKRDMIATASLVTPLAVHDAWRRYSNGTRYVDDLIVSGGGARNRFFLAALEELFGSKVVRLSDEFGIPWGEKEAICFAVLAFETFAGRTSNLPSVTGAARRMVLGKICQP
jgi:anhydro-N-acetylmuramic acid kinase